MTADLASISSEAELVAFLRSLRTAIDEGLRSLGHDPDDDVAGYVARALTIGLHGVGAHVVPMDSVFAAVADADVVIDLRAALG